MKEFKKKDKNNFWSSPLILAVLIAMFLFLAYKVIVLIKTERQTAEKKELILKEIDSLKDREQSLNEDITKMQTEAGIEDAIRGKFQVTKPGEKMVTIVEEQAKIPSEDKVEVDHSFWGWVKGLFNKN
jgi:cell division protein FtsB